MSLSKKNLDKLNNLIKNENLKHENKINNHKTKNKNDKDSINQLKKENPSRIFYSLIDNSPTLNETSQVNQILRKSEEEYINFNSEDSEYSKHLTIEDELYDEFNYLLDE